MSRPHRSSLSPQPDQAPPRATTAPVKKQHHIPHHPHRVHVHRRYEQRVAQSAVELRAGSNALGDSAGGIRSTGSSGREGMESTSRDASQRESGMEGEQKKTVTWTEVERARSKKKKMDDDLRSTLSSLSTLATTSTRRLDYAYYSLLERISAIISTVDGFLDLSQHTSSLCRDFSTSISDIDSDFSSQIASFDDTFASQRHKIEGLESRLHDAKQKARVLAKRLETARGKVESWGKREREWQARTSRRLMTLGCVLGAVGWVFIMLLGLRHWQSGGNRFRDLGRGAWNRTVGLGEL